MVIDRLLTHDACSGDDDDEGERGGKLRKGGVVKGEQEGEGDIG